MLYLLVSTHNVVDFRSSIEKRKITKHFWCSLHFFVWWIMCGQKFTLLQRRNKSFNGAAVLSIAWVNRLWCGGKWCPLSSPIVLILIPIPTISPIEFSRDVNQVNPPATLHRYKAQLNTASRSTQRGMLFWIFSKRYVLQIGLSIQNVVKTLTKILCSSRDGFHWKLREKIADHPFQNNCRSMPFWPTSIL